SLEIADAPAGAHAIHEFPDEGAIETDLEVRVTKAAALEAKRQRGKLTVPRHHGPDAADRPAEIDALPSRSRFGLNESAAAPLPRRQREFFNDGLSGIRKNKIAIASIEVNAAHANSNRIDSIEPGSSHSGHYIREAWRTPHPQDCNQSGF